METEEKTSIWWDIATGAVFLFAVVGFVYSVYQAPLLWSWFRRDDLEQRVELIERNGAYKCRQEEFPGGIVKEGVCTAGLNGNPFLAHFIPYQD